MGQDTLSALIFAIFLAGLVAFISLFGVIVFVSLFPQYRKQSQPSNRDRQGLLIAGPLFLGLLTLYVWCFGVYMYEYIPNVVGGGRPQRVRLLPKPDNIQRLKLLGLEIRTGSDISFPLDLLFQTEKLLYLRTSSGATFEMTHESIVGIDTKTWDQGTKWELTEVDAAAESFKSELLSVKDNQLHESLVNEATTSVKGVLKQGPTWRTRSAKSEGEYSSVLQQYEDSLPSGWVCDSTCNRLASAFELLTSKAAAASK